MLVHNLLHFDSMETAMANDRSRLKNCKTVWRMIGIAAKRTESSQYVCECYYKCTCRLHRTLLAERTPRRPSSNHTILRRPEAPH
jgi:hypothetical protein